MGIQGLLRNLRSIVKERHLDQYRGQTLAVDTYSWLHKVIKTTCVMEIAENQVTDRFVRQIMTRIRKLSGLGIKLIMVFDGALLPGKRQQQKARAANRKSNLEKAREFKLAGDAENAYKKFSESIDITPDLAYILIKELRVQNIEFIVAPFQADAQLAYLSRSQMVHAIITEDSDLLAFGARKILYKIDYKSMMAQEINYCQLKDNKEPNFFFFNENMFLTTCILSGCDYLQQIPGVGLKTAHKVVQKNRTVRKVMTQLHRTYRQKMPLDYQRGFVEAYLSFRLQKVYCPRQQRVRHLNLIDLGAIEEAYRLNDQSLIDQALLDIYLVDQLRKPAFNFEFIEPVDAPDHILKQIALGLINPHTFTAYKDLTLVNSYMPVFQPKKPQSLKQNKITKRDPLQQSLKGFVVQQRVVKISQNRPSNRTEGQSIESQFELNPLKSKTSKPARHTASYQRCKQLLQPIFPVQFFSQPLDFIRRHKYSFQP